MTTIHQEVVLNAGTQKIYEALIDSKQFSEITGGAPTEINPEAGGSFSPDRAPGAPSLRPRDQEAGTQRSG